MLKVCIVCGREFDAQNKAKCCSPECSKYHNGEYNRQYKSTPKARERQRQRRSTPEYKRYERQLSATVWRKKYMREYGYRRRATAKFREYGRIKTHNRRARKRNLPNTFTPEQWRHALDYFHGCCAVCGRQMNDLFGEFYPAADHWIPLSYKGKDNPGTTATNIIPLCHGVGGCNNKKNSTMPDEWLEREYGKRKAKEIIARIETYFESII